DEHEQRHSGNARADDAKHVGRKAKAKGYAHERLGNGVHGTGNAPRPAGPQGRQQPGENGAPAPPARKAGAGQGKPGPRPDRAAGGVSQGPPAARRKAGPGATGPEGRCGQSQVRPESRPGRSGYTPPEHGRGGAPAARGTGRFVWGFSSGETAMNGTTWAEV